MSDTGSTTATMTTTRLTIAVTVGVLLAALLSFMVYEMRQPSDFECSAQHVEYQLGDRAIYEIDDACR